MAKKTTKIQFETYLIDVKGYGSEEVEESTIEYDCDLEAYLRDAGADDEVIKEMWEYLK